MRKKYIFSAQNKICAQSSIEYLLILTAFFAALGLIIPAISYGLEGFFLANDTILAKNISEQLKEECSLFSFAGNGSYKEVTYGPSKSINFKSDGTNIAVSSPQKSFSFSCKTNQAFEKFFETKFMIKLYKENNSTFINFETI